MTTLKETIISKAVDILKRNPNGLRFSDLVRTIHNDPPDIAVNSLKWTVWELNTLVPDEVSKPARGFFRYADFAEREPIKEDQKPTHRGEKVEEKDFYEPLADWLVNELEECTKAIPLGGNKFRDKWGTPDVIGKREPLGSDIVKGPTEIVSAEIKSDTRDLITAFGQACSYKVFSHKSYIVVPRTSSADDISRLDSLSLIFGIGLVLFDNASQNEPQFEIRVPSVLLAEIILTGQAK